MENVVITIRKGHNCWECDWTTPDAKSHMQYYVLGEDAKLAAFRIASALLSKSVSVTIERED